MSGQILLFLIVAAIADVVGAVLFLLRRRWDDEALRVLVATGAGFMLAVALVEMMPEALKQLPIAGVWVIGGFLLVHLAEHVLTPHFHYGHETHAGLGAHVGVAAALGLMVHSVIDGIAIVVTAQTSPHPACCVCGDGLVQNSEVHRVDCHATGGYDAQRSLPHVARVASLVGGVI